MILDCFTVVSEIRGQLISEWSIFVSDYLTNRYGHWVLYMISAWFETHLVKQKSSSVYKIICTGCDLIWDQLKMFSKVFSCWAPSNLHLANDLCFDVAFVKKIYIFCTWSVIMQRRRRVWMRWRLSDSFPLASFSVFTPQDKDILKHFLKSISTHKSCLSCPILLCPILYSSKLSFVIAKRSLNSIVLLTLVLLFSFYTKRYNYPNEFRHLLLFVWHILIAGELNWIHSVQHFILVIEEKIKTY